MSELQMRPMGGGKSEGTNIYEVCEKMISHNVGRSTEIRCDQGGSFICYDSIDMNEDGNLSLSGQRTIPESDLHVVGTDNYTGKYVEEGGDFWIITSRFTWDSRHEWSECVAIMVDVVLTRVKYGVNDDPAIYVSEVKGSDGYYRINYSL